MKINKKQIEKTLGNLLYRGWILDGPGPARFGWARITPCKLVWIGKTLKNVKDAL